MGFTARPPSQESNVFNPNFFASSTDILSLEMADSLYLSKTDYRMSYLSSITMGTASPMSALVVDANRDIININSISCGSLKLNGSNVDLSSLSLLTASPGAASNNKALIVGSSGQIAGLSSLTATNLTGTLQTAAQPNITSVGTLGSLIINSVFSKGLAIQNDSTTSAASLNIVSYYQMEQGIRGSSNSTTPNTYFWRFALSDRLLMDINGNLNIGGSSINTSYKLDVNGAIRGTSFVQGTTTYDLSLIPRLSLTTLGTVEASKALVADASYGITGLRSLTLVGSGLSKSLVIQNDTTTSSASLNFASYYQAELGVRGSANTSGANQFFLKYALSDRLIMDINGNVNIGGSSINTSYKLDVAGALNCSSLTIGGVSVSPQTNILEVPDGTSFIGSTKFGSYNLNLRNQSDNQGTGVAATSGICFLNDAGIGPTNYTPSCAIYASRVSGTFAASDLIFSTRSATSSSTDDLAERMRITRAGHIRFGSSSSVAKIDIQSSASLLTGSWQRALRISNEAATPIQFEIWLYNDISGGTYGTAIGNTTSDPLRFMINNSTKMYLNDSGRLGIGITSPEGDLHASGAIWSNYGMHCKSSSVSPMYRWANTTTSYPCIGNHVNNVAGIRFATCDASWVYNGYAPCYGGAYTNSSDRRLKKDIIDLPYGLETILKMKPRQFTWISDDKRAIGFIAQEMINIVPEPVYVPEDSDELNPDGTPKSGWGVDYACLTSILCKAIQEQNVIIMSIKSKLEELEKKINELT